MGAHCVSTVLKKVAWNVSKGWCVPRGLITDEGGEEWGTAG